MYYSLGSINHINPTALLLLAHSFAIFTPIQSNVQLVSDKMANEYEWGPIEIVTELFQKEN